MSANKKAQTVFPDLPRNNNIVDINTGKINDGWALYFQQLTQTLQYFFSNEGFKLPTLTENEIDQLGNISDSIGRIMYDSSNNVPKCIIQTGINPITTTIKTFTLT
jgi:hypothetical protein